MSIVERARHARPLVWAVAGKLALRWNRPVQSALARHGKLFRETTMREGKTFADGSAIPSRWLAEHATQPGERPSPWRVSRWFARKPATLYQRCLAVHIYNASKQTAMH